MAADDTTVDPAGSLGLEWAAFILGVPESFSIDDFVAPDWFGREAPLS